MAEDKLARARPCGFVFSFDLCRLHIKLGSRPALIRGPGCRSHALIDIDLYTSKLPITDPSLSLYTYDGVRPQLRVQPVLLP